MAAVTRLGPGGYPIPALYSGTTYNETVTESAAAVDTVSAAGVFPETITETVSAVDTVSAGAVFAEVIVEAASAADAFDAAAVFASSVAEALAASDAFRLGNILFLSIVESTHTDDGFSSTVTPEPTSTFKYRIQVIDPRYMTIEHWSALVAASLRVFGYVPSWTTEDDWQRWALSVRSLPTLSALQIPDPRSYGDDWQGWVFRLNEALLNL